MLTIYIVRVPYVFNCHLIKMAVAFFNNDTVHFGCIVFSYQT